MSDTFLIKKTNYNDAGTNAELLSNSFVLGPGELNGPGGSARDSDLKLYGSGSVKWGEGIIQNLYRLMENNACAPKVTGDHLPLAYGGSDTPNSDYNTTLHLILPRDEIDLGLGNGVTNPIEGQSWYNTVNGIMYNFVFGGSPLLLQWLSGGEGETILEGDLNLANTYEIYNVAAPSGSPVDSYVGNVGWNDTRYLNVDGDTMAGTLSLGNNRITDLLVTGSPGSNDVVNLGYISDNFMSSVGGNEITTDLTFTHSGAAVYETAGISWVGNADEHKIYVEQYTSTNSCLVLRSGNNADTDYISFRSYNGSTTVETLRVKRTSLDALVPIQAGSIIASDSIVVDSTMTISHGTSSTPTNIAIGNTTLPPLASVTAAEGCIAIGNNTLSNTTIGNSNVAIGNACLANNTTGYLNIALGSLALNANTTGNSNVSIGSGLSNNISGVRNISFINGLNNNTTGDDNIAIGNQALNSSASGDDNVAIGYRALYEVTGSNNVGIGSFTSAGGSGNANTAIGTNALNHNTFGSYNCAMGQSAHYWNNTSTYCVAIGYSSMYDAASGTYNTAIGALSLNALTSGSNNTALGYSALQFNTSGNPDTAMDNCTGVGFDTRTSGNNQVQLGDSTTTTYAFGAVQNRSDIRDKADVRDTVLGLSFINKLRPVDFRWDMRDDYFDRIEGDPSGSPVIHPTLVPVSKDGTRKRTRFHHGLVAQEVESVIASTGIDFGGFQAHDYNNDGSDVKTIGYAELIGPLIKAVQELSARVALLESVG